MYFFILIAGLVTLHYVEVEEYKVVKEHMLYKDIVDPTMAEIETFMEPLIYEVMRIPQVAELFGINPEDYKPENSVAPTDPSGKHIVADDRQRQAMPDEVISDGRSPASNLKFTSPSQMKFSLAELGDNIEKRSILSTEGDSSNYFEIPDGSRLWLAPDSVVEAGWVSGDEADVPAVLLRVEKGVMHVERRAGSMGKLYIVTNSGIRYSVAPSDGWLAAAYEGVFDPEENPDAAKMAKGRSTDYARRANWSEANKLIQVLEADQRREGMLAQDNLRQMAEKEEKKKNQAIGREQLLPVEVVSVPLEIESRRGDSSMSGRAPASVGEGEFDKFPARGGRGPASVSQGLQFDQTAQTAAETRIERFMNAGQCSEAMHLFKRTVDRYSLGRSSRWRQEMNSTLEEGCTF